MKRKDLLNNWLGDRRRKFADGLLLFESLAPDVMRSRYGDYLRQGPAVENPFDPRFTQLTNCLSRIARDIRLGVASPAADEEAETAPVEVSAEERESARTVRAARIGALEAANLELEERIGHLEDDSGTHAGEIDALSRQMEANLEEILDLRRELDDLNKPGVKVVTESSLPAPLRRQYNRLKQIVPLYASLHADLCNPALPDDDRKRLADKLCDLDDERRSIWDSIDRWSEGKQVELEAQRPEYSDNAVVRGYEIARQMKRLRGNISASKAAARKAEAGGRETVYRNAVERIARYERELRELESTLRAEESDGREPV